MQRPNSNCCTLSCAIFPSAAPHGQKNPRSLVCGGGVKNETRCDSSWQFVGADDSVRPRNSFIFRGRASGPMPTSARQNVTNSHRFSVKTDNSGGRTGSSAPTVENGKPTRFRRKTVIKRVLSAGRCRHRPLRRGTENAAIFAGHAWFSKPSVGADDSVRPPKS